MKTIEDRQGNAFSKFYPVSGQPRSEPVRKLVFSVVVASFGAQCLMVKNKHKNQWELPGGYIELRESPLDAVIRETLEETNQTIVDPVLFGTMQYLSARDGLVSYGAIYTARLPGNQSFHSGLASFQENNEVSQICLWDGRPISADYINPIDKALVRLVNAGK